MIHIKKKTKDVSQNKDPADLSELPLPGTEGPGELLEPCSRHAAAKVNCYLLEKT